VVSSTAVEANEANWRVELAHWPLDPLQGFARIGFVAREITSENARFASKVLGLIHAGQPVDGALLALLMALSKGSPSKGSVSSHFLRLRFGGLYIGASMNLEHGFDHHASGRGRRTTRVDPPVSVWRIESFPAFTKDRSREPQLKRWTCEKNGGFLGKLICFMPSVNPGNVGMAESKGGVAAEGTSPSCRGLD
jgi:predicted GIY-YIG superfamily endonuclease